jgi:excisionase family DNA binding protein
MKYLPIRKAAEELGLHPNTIRKYADEGVLPSYRTEGGQRRVSVEAYKQEQLEGKTVCYCRVSTRGQKDDLDRQVAFMRERYPEAEIVTDIGSALNYKRKGLKTLLGRALRGEQLKIVVAHKDRLVRFGFEFVQYIIEKCGGKIVVLDKSAGTEEDELVEDLLAIIHVFSCRLYGKRNYKNKKNKNEAELSAEKDN